jgi:hypothetical protein
VTEYSEAVVAPVASVWEVSRPSASWVNVSVAPVASVVAAIMPLNPTCIAIVRPSASVAVDGQPASS